jgi:hypothetical protein
MKNRQEEPAGRADRKDGWEREATEQAERTRRKDIKIGKAEP